MTSERYARQAIIEGWNQRALQQARVIVAGAGALGNEVIKNLALLGVGQLLIIDFDRVELSNLSRTVLFRTADLGRPKAQVAAEAVIGLNPDVHVSFIHGDLLFDIGLGVYRHTTLVVGALDSLAARSRVGVSCALAGVPYVDGGMWALGGEVRWFLPGEGPCFDCTLSEEDRQHAFERRSCTGFRLDDGDLRPQLVPATASTSAVVGGLLAQEAARYLCGLPVFDGQAAVFNGLSWTMHRATLSRNPTCPYHAAYHDVIELEEGAGTVSARQLLARARQELGESGILQLGRDFLVAFHCSTCGRREPVDRRLSQVDEGEARCPTCGTYRRTEIVSALGASDHHVERRLSALGVPPGEVVAVRCGEVLRLYELSGDLASIWNREVRR